MKDVRKPIAAVVDRIITTKTFARVAEKFVGYLALLAAANITNMAYSFICSEPPAMLMTQCMTCISFLVALVLCELLRFTAIAIKNLVKKLKDM